MYNSKDTIEDIQNKDDQCYSWCKRFQKKVKFIKETATCTKCNRENFEYEMRLLSLKTPLNIY